MSFLAELLAFLAGTAMGTVAVAVPAALILYALDTRDRAFANNASVNSEGYHSRMMLKYYKRTRVLGCVFAVFLVVCMVSSWSLIARAALVATFFVMFLMACLACYHMSARDKAAETTERNRQEVN